MPDKELIKETKESLEEVNRALEVVQNFAERHWKPCLRDCCGEAMSDVEERFEQICEEQGEEDSPQFKATRENLEKIAKDAQGKR